MGTKIFFPSKDGLKICGILHPAHEKPKGNVVLAHGITVDKDEDPDSDTNMGVFLKLALLLVEKGYNVFQFDFRGHGESEGTQEEMTIMGELGDLTASIEYAKRTWPFNTSIVAASFGAISAVMYTAQHKDIPCMVLWNPVLDLRKTFIEPICPWGKQFFNYEGFNFLEKNGYLYLEGFKIGYPLVEEMNTIKPYEYLQKIDIPVLTMHGNEDTYVPYEISKKYAVCNTNSELITIQGSDHGFGRKTDREYVVNKTIEWIQKWV